MKLRSISTVSHEGIICPRCFKSNRDSIFRDHYEKLIKCEHCGEPLRVVYEIVERVTTSCVQYLDQSEPSSNQLVG